MQVHQLVPVGWAWWHGAAVWTGERREQLATDFIDLQDVDGLIDEPESDQGPATWIPPAPGYDCLYVTRFAYVLSTYELAIDDADRVAIDRTLSSCSRAPSSAPARLRLTAGGT
ncbi:hypothetical protein [Clavibacter michiganensis]|uniref:hypothetical protein n=1 Tax=Clavibacter michiganensis TaxID=28447 RepID=UPI003593465E